MIGGDVCNETLLIAEKISASSGNELRATKSAGQHLATEAPNLKEENWSMFLIF